MKLFVVKSAIIVFGGCFVLSFFSGFYFFFNVKADGVPEFLANLASFIDGFSGTSIVGLSVCIYYLALHEQKVSNILTKESITQQTEEIRLNRESLNSQIEEISLQREQIRQATQIFRKQSELQNQQMFETSFFNLLNIHNNILSVINVTKFRNAKINYRSYPPSFEEVHNSEMERHVIIGRDCFVEFQKRFSLYYNDDDPSLSIIDIINKAWAELYKNDGTDLRHYYRNLYHIFKYIDDAILENNIKKKYAKIVASQLSDSELFMLIYNCLSFHGKEKFKPLIEKYGVLSSFERSLLIHPNHDDLIHGNAYK